MKAKSIHVCLIAGKGFSGIWLTVNVVSIMP